MAKASIGQFIAALRKAKGMTQQDIAQRLNVSNKAVSRWERDECAPDISLIPALAELLGVTCDELLKGERILRTDMQLKGEGREERVDKQVKALLNRALSNFKTLIWTALAASAVGLILMFGISYGFYRPVIGFAVMLLFETVSFVITVSAVTRVRDEKTDNDVFEMADKRHAAHFDSVFGNLSFLAFYVILSSVTLSIPLILFSDSHYVNSVLSFESYAAMLFGIILLLVPVYLKCRMPYIAWVTGNGSKTEKAGFKRNDLMRMNLIQLGAAALAGIVFVLAPYLDTKHYDVSIGYLAANIVGLGIMAASVICFVVFAVRKKGIRILLSGARNILLLPADLIISNMHSVGWVGNQPIGGGTSEWYTRYDLWFPEYLYYALWYSLAVFAVFALIEELIKRRKRR